MDSVAFNQSFAPQCMPDWGFDDNISQLPINDDWGFDSNMSQLPIIDDWGFGDNMSQLPINDDWGFDNNMSKLPIIDDWGFGDDQDWFKPSTDLALPWESKEIRNLPHIFAPDERPDFSGLRDLLDGGLKKVQDWAMTESIDHTLRNRASQAFAEFGESDVTTAAFRDLQWGRVATGWVSSIQDAVGLAEGLVSREAEVFDRARGGDIRGAANHAWGSAAEIFASQAASIIDAPARRLGLGEVAGRAVEQIGLSAALYEIGSRSSDLLFDQQVALAVRLSELTGRPLRPGVMEHYEAMQNSR